MHQATLLEERLASILPWNRARLKFLSRLLVALLTVRTVNLAEIAVAIASPAKLESRYKQLQRFFRHFDLSADALSQLLARLCGVPAPWVLSLDRTEWKLGQKHAINFLVVAIVGEGVAYPICWMSLNKPGASNAAERRKLLRRFVNLFGASSIDFLCMDREFGGQQWLHWLLKAKIDFRLRIKSNSLLSNAQGKPVPVRRLFGYLKVHEALWLNKPRRLWGAMICVSVLKLSPAKEGDPFLIVVSADKAEDALADYALRWNIETLFGALKSRGFRLEDTRLHHQARLEKLFGILALLFTWAHLVGQWAASVQPLRRIARRAHRLARSVFRAGLDFLRELIVNPGKIPNRKGLKLTLQFLSCA
jgi:Transposase DDE domain